MKKITQILINLALFLMNALKITWLAISGLFIFVYKPVRLILKFFYHLFVLPIYRFYLLVTKRSGLGKDRGQKLIKFLLLNKRLLHILVVGLFVIMIYNNLTMANRDLSAEDVVGKTMLAKLVSDEFLTADEMIEETRPTINIAKHNYFDKRMVTSAKGSIHTKTNPEEDVLIDSVFVLDEEDTNVRNTERTIPTRTETISYEVAVGDTLSSIANKFGISISTILWENSLTAKSYIRPGDKLAILPVSGVSHKIVRGESLKSIAKKYGVDEEDLLAINKVGANIKIGKTLIIPGGRPLSEGVSIARTTTPTRRTDTGRVSTANLSEPKESAGRVSGAKMNWPTTGYRITQYYSWRHNGLDIANKIGTPIYAADDGVVETAGWNSGGYGNQIVINHGGGKKTRYGHLSAFSVRVGQEVEKGQYIAAMGSTGHSTGPHIHFEVMFSGRRYNPLNYVAY